jgi:superfamily I DNA/RNA helicase
MAWIVPYNKLDEQQKDFIDNMDINRRNIWIKGFPGSGKSVLLAHTIKKIKASNVSMVVVVFTQSLVEMFNAAFREMGIDIDVITYYAFMKSSRSYDYVLCDEVQDLTPRVLRKMDSRAKHIVVAGDSNQSIYESDPQFHESVVKASEINNLINANNFELSIIHRLSSSIIGAIQKFLPRMNIFSSKRDMTKQTTQVRICQASSSNEEVKYIMREAQKAVNVGQTAAILIPSQQKIIDFVDMALVNEGKREWNKSLNHWNKPDFRLMNEYLKQNDIKLMYIGNGYGEFSESDRKITIMTYHSSKGLDFDNVFLPFLNSHLYIVPNESLSKTLFMVAMSRSRNNLYLTYYGYESSYLDAFKNDCVKIDIHDSLNSTVRNSNISFGI